MDSVTTDTGTFTATHKQWALMLDNTLSKKEQNVTEFIKNKVKFVLWTP